MNEGHMRCTSKRNGMRCLLERGKRQAERAVDVRRSVLVTRER